MSMQGALAKQKWEAIVEQTEPIIQGIEEASFTPSDLKRLASAIRSQSEIAGKVFEHQLSLYDQQVAKLNELIKDKLSANNIPATEANVQKVADKIFAGLVQHDWSQIAKQIQKALANDKASKAFQNKIDKIAKNTDPKNKQNSILDLKGNSGLQKFLKVTVGLPLRLAVNKQLRTTLRNEFKQFRTQLRIRVQKLWGILRNPGKYFKQALSSFGNKVKDFTKHKISNAATYLGFTKEDKKAALEALPKIKSSVVGKTRSILQPVLPNAVAELRDNKKRALRAKVLSNMRDMGLNPQNINSASHIIRANWPKDKEHIIQISSAYRNAKDTAMNAYDNSRVGEFITVFNEWRKEQDVKQRLKDKWERVKTSKISKLVGKSLDKYKKLYKESKDQIEEVGASNFFKSMLDKLGGWKYILGGGLAVAIGTALWKAFDVGEFLKKVGSSIWKWFVDLLPDSVKKIFGIEDSPAQDIVMPNYGKGNGITEQSLAEKGVNQDKAFWDKFIGPDEKFKHLPDPRTTDYSRFTSREKAQLSRGNPQIRRMIDKIANAQTNQEIDKSIQQREQDKKNLSEAQYNKKYGTRINTASNFDLNDTAIESKPKTANTKSVMADKVNTTDLSTPVPKREQTKTANNKQKSGTGAGNVFNLSTVPLYGRRDNDGLAVINTFSY